MEGNNWIATQQQKFDTWLATDKSILQPAQKKSESRNFADWLQFCEKTTMSELIEGIMHLNESITNAKTSSDHAYVGCRQLFIDAANDQLKRRNAR